MSVRPIPEGYHTVTPYVLTDDVDGLVDLWMATHIEDLSDKELAERARAQAW